MLDNFYFDFKTGFAFEYGGMQLKGDFSKQEKIAKIAMKKIISGEIMNPDENRMVGHYWLRNPKIAPKDVESEIIECQNKIFDFTEKIHKNGQFVNAIICGIGGSSLGPEFISKALKKSNDNMQLFFLDNTDPDGMDKVFLQVKPDLEKTLVIVISKSGGTIETRNSMLECKNFYKNNNVDFNSHAVCITGIGSKLYNTATSEKWLDIFPMWDYVGGRTSVMSAVGLLPLSLQGIKVKELLDGAKSLDENDSAALTMAKCWYSETKGKGGKTLVILPYKDSLILLAKYLQQLIMESLGKEFDLDGKIVNQGLAVMGNKGTSDQHSYCQQLVAGPKNVFITFIEVRKDRESNSIIVGENSTSGEYLAAFMLGTKKALESHGKHTMTISIPEVSAFYIGMIIALFERAVSYYAAMININAYHQPAVEYGKKCASELIDLKNKSLDYLKKEKAPKTATEIAKVLNANEEDIFRILFANPKVSYKNDKFTLI